MITHMPPWIAGSSRRTSDLVCEMVAADPRGRQQRDQRHHQREGRRDGDRADDCGSNDSGNRRHVAPAEADKKNGKCRGGVENCTEGRLKACAQHEKCGGQSGECAEAKHFRIQWFHGRCPALSSS
jgi:hypothetical protein